MSGPRMTVLSLCRQLGGTPPRHHFSGGNLCRIESTNGRVARRAAMVTATSLPVIFMCPVLSARKRRPTCALAQTAAGAAELQKWSVKGSRIVADALDANAHHSADRVRGCRRHRKMPDQNVSESLQRLRAFRSTDHGGREHKS